MIVGRIRMRNYSIWVSGSKSKQKCKANLLSILCNCFKKDVYFEKKEVHYVLVKVAINLTGLVVNLAVL